MVWQLFLGLSLVCSGLCLVSCLYVCPLWYASTTAPIGPAREKPARGLSAADLQRLGDGGAATGVECTICLDDIEAGQPARVLPSCHHAFHLACADAWLANEPSCPICRASLLVPPPPSPPPLSQPST